MKKTLVSFLALSLLVACESESLSKPKGEIVSGVSDSQTTDAELAERIKQIEKDEAKRMEEEKLNVTSVEFDRLVHDFGTVASETNNSTTFKVTNTGKKPLIIDEVKASCGCTTPKKPEKPILPGESDVITVNFRPTEAQKNDQMKTITVAANTEPRLSVLTIKAFVK